MKVLDRQVSRAQRRMTTQKFLQVFIGWLFVLLLAVVGVILLNWRMQWGIQPEVCAGIGIGVAVFGALVWSIVFRPRRMQAAIELDRRCGLKERVSSTLAMSPSEHQTPAGRALATDAVRRAQGVSVREKFGLRLGRWSWLPLLPATAAFMLALWLPKIEDPEAEAKEKEIIKAKVIKRNVVDPLKKEIAKRKAEAKKAGLKELEKAFEKLYQDVERNLTEKNMTRKEAMAKLNDLSRDLQKRRDKLNVADEMKKQLEDLKGLGQDGPGDKLAKALKEGDFAKAMKEVDKLMKDLKAGKLDPKQQKDLANRLKQIADKLNKMAQQQQQKKDALKKQIQQALKKGDKAAANKLQQQLNKLNQQDQQMKQMQRMAQKMGQCAKCLGQGNQQQAMAGLGGMKAELQELQQQLQELQMLDAALDDLAMGKDELMQMLGGMGMGNGNKRSKSNWARGKGRGEGFRDEKKDTGEKFTNSNVKGQLQRKGAFGVVGEIDGPNAKGKAREFIQGDLKAGRSEESDPTTVGRLPKGYRDQVREYMNKFRTGE